MRRGLQLVSHRVRIEQVAPLDPAVHSMPQPLPQPPQPTAAPHPVPQPLPQPLPQPPQRGSPGFSKKVLDSFVAGVSCEAGRRAASNAFEGNVGFADGWEAVCGAGSFIYALYKKEKARVDKVLEDRGVNVEEDEEGSVILTCKSTRDAWDNLRANLDAVSREMSEVFGVEVRVTIDSVEEEEEEEESFPPRGSEVHNVPLNMLRSVVPLYLGNRKVRPSDEEQYDGTGVFLEHDRSVYLVTALHVVCDLRTDKRTFSCHEEGVWFPRYNYDPSGATGIEWFFCEIKQGRVFIDQTGFSFDCVAFEVFVITNRIGGSELAWEGQ